MDFSKLSDQDLEAIASGNYSAASDQALEMLAAQATPESGLIPDLKRAGGIAARSIMQGVNDIPNMVADPFVNFYNMATGSSVPTFTQRQESIYNNMGLPTPQGSEKYANTGMRVLGGAGLLGAASKAIGSGAGLLGQTAKELSANPATQMAGALGGQGAMQLGQEGGVSNPYALMGLGMIGGVGSGMGSAAAGNLNQRLGRGGQALAQPLYKSGREDIVGRILNQITRDRPTAMANLENASPLVKGSLPTTAAASRDVGLAGAETAIRALDQSNKFGQRIGQQNIARSEELQRLAGLRGGDKLEYAKIKRDELTAPMREKAFVGAGNVDETSVLSMIDSRLSGVTAVRPEVQKALDFAKAQVSKANGSPERLYEAKKAIQAARMGKYDGNSEAPMRMAASELKQIERSIDNTIEKAAPGYRDYLTQYAKMSKPIDQMELMRGIFTQSTKGQTDLQTGMPIITAQTLRTQFSNKAQEMGETLSRSQQALANRLIQDIDRGMAATSPGVKVPGSDTFKNLSMGNLIGRMFSESAAENPSVRTLTRPLDWLYSLPNQTMNELLVDAMLDPKLARDLMKKADKSTVESVSKRMKERAVQIGVGASQGSEPFYIDINGVDQ